MRSLNKIEISAEALRHNFGICKQRAGSADVLAMVKADAYGHGMVDCARVFVEEGAVALGVAEVAEGIILREAGFTCSILVFAGIIPETIDPALAFGLTPVVTDKSIAAELDRRAAEIGKVVDVHIKMDAGMGRQGTLPAEMEELVQLIQSANCLSLKGILAHFPMADVRSSKNSAEVLGRFNRAVKSIRTCLTANCHYHIANSGALFYLPEARLDMVRPGISLYGCYPDGEDGVKEEKGEPLKPVMRFTTKVIQVRRVPEGVGLGYGQSTVTKRPTTLAVLPLGYEDGYLRRLSNRAEVLVGGCRAQVIGRISMNLTLVDVTDLAPVSVGDEVVILGCQGDQEITADEVADWMETINYEVLCLFGKMNDRLFVDSSSN